jgi:DNA-binding NtrC family response regulator
MFACIPTIAPSGQTPASACSVFVTGRFAASRGTGGIYHFLCWECGPNKYRFAISLMPDVVYSLLVIDRDVGVAADVNRALLGLPVALLRAGDWADGVSYYREFLPQMVLLDSEFVDGEVPLHDLFAGDSTLEVVLMADRWTQAGAQAAVARGASDLFTKPLEPFKVRQLVLGPIAQAETRRRTQEIDNELLEAYQFHGMVGRSPKMLEVFSRVRRVAPLFQTVLITGPTGTGKELIARALHSLSPRSREKFVVCNCSALAETLVESQLFGHVKGAFTGSTQDRAGLFEYANRGTLFLDEIGELSLAAQAKLLRILQSQELQRVGSPVATTVDVHVIAATNRDVRELASKGEFREDLFYRLSMIEIQLPPLADRKEDLPLLQRHFLQHFSTKYGKKLNGISRRAQILLARHPWPGNVRELENVIGNACMMAQGKFVSDLDLPEAVRVQLAKPDMATGLVTLEEVQARHLEYVLKLVDGNKARAAEVLGVSRATIYDMLARRGRQADQSNNRSA